MSQGLVVYAKNKQRVSAFYQMTLGLLTEASDTFHDLLRGHGHEIVVHAIPQEYATDITIEQPPRPREDTPFKPVFVVGSLAEVRRAAEASGGHLRPDSHAWEYLGHKVLDGWDPEGNIVQFKQPLQQFLKPRQANS